MEPFAIVLVALWAMLPAYVPNNVAVLAGGGPPIDGGRTYRGSRLLGDGKTWRGTAGGVLAGAALAFGLNAVAPSVGPLAGVEALPQFGLAVAFALPAGAMCGDIAASFLKRRLDRERGAPLPGVDQLDFVVGALLFASLVDFAWVIEWFSLEVLAFVLVVTPLLHLGTNFAAYQLSLKSEPW
jgi:CDP-2,3-bis-(O-geranylgeranyl)-sn-glycerol synthase